MNISARTEYACIALLELALQRSGDPIRIRSIAEAHGIPSQFLVQILLQLKNASLVRSTRGAAGGYHLAKSPKDISLGDIVEAIEGPLSSADSSAADTAVTRVVRQTWKDVAESCHQKLMGITLQQLADDAAQPTENMYYI